MKRIITGLTAALAFALAGVGSARAADETDTTTSKTTVKKNKDGTETMKSEKKSTHDPKGMGSTTDKSTYTKEVDKNAMGGTTTKVEKKATHDAPGTAGDSTTSSSSTTERDATGKVVKEEKQGPTTTK
jgi:hypothetical protein